eukprot:3052411-Pleurochrysis_carterae.AAC.2
MAMLTCLVRVSRLRTHKVRSCMRTALVSRLRDCNCGWSPSKLVLGCIMDASVCASALCVCMLDVPLRAQTDNWGTQSRN